MGIINKSVIRVITGAFLLILFADIGFVVIHYINDESKDIDIYGFFLLIFGVFFYAALVSGIQAVIYSFIMETINIRTKNNLMGNISFIAYSSFLSILVGFFPGFALNQIITFSILGVIAGFIVGIILRLMYLKHPHINQMTRYNMGIIMKSGIRIITGTFLFMLIFASFYPIGTLPLLQAVIYSIIMELINKRTNNNLKGNITFITYSSFLSFLLRFFPDFALNQIITFLIFGVIAGFIVGIILRLMYLKQESR